MSSIAQERGAAELQQSFAIEAINRFTDAMVALAGLDPDAASHLSEIEYRRSGDDPAVITIHVPKGFAQINKTGDPRGHGSTIYFVKDGRLHAHEAYTAIRQCDTDEEAVFGEELAKRPEAYDLSLRLSYTT